MAAQHNEQPTAGTTKDRSHPTPGDPHPAPRADTGGAVETPGARALGSVFLRALWGVLGAFRARWGVA